jgi:hypothetical protein
VENTFPRHAADSAHVVRLSTHERDDPKARAGAAPIFGGRFHANRPVIGGRTARGAASSSIFYGSHAETTGAGEFGLRVARGFEIMTFVLQGENAHDDTETRRSPGAGSRTASASRRARARSRSDSIRICAGR